MQSYPTNTVHDPALYNPTKFAQPLNGFSKVNEQQIKLYHQQGYLAIENAFSLSEINSAIAGLSNLILGGNPDFKSIQFEQRLLEGVPQNDLHARELAVRKIMYFVNFEPRLNAIAQHPELLSLIIELIGNQPPKLFQDMALIKAPDGSEKPWHQDQSYFNYPIATPVVGVWIALDEATVDNGCMHLMPGQHLEPIEHFKRRDWQICDDQILGYSCTAVPLKPGGCLLFDGLLPHGTPHNHSNTRRRALQFHYMPLDTVEITEDDRLAVFGGEGRGATC